MIPEWQDYAETLRGRRFAIIGDGSSLRGVDLSLPRDVVVIAVNDSLHGYPRADLFFTLDCTWFLRSESRRALRGFAGWKVVALPEERFILRGLAEGPKERLVRYERRHATGISLEAGTINAGNSGFGALNLACLLGASEVALHGFDLHPGQGVHARRPPNHRYTPSECRRQVEQFESSAEQVRSLGVRVLNANPDSAIRCFPFARVAS